MKSFLIFLISNLLLLEAHAFTLVSQDEMAQSNSAPLKLTAKLAPPKDAPQIEVETPPINGSITSPTPVKIRFQAVAPSSVKPETFKVLYGSWELNITSRITGKTKVTEQGLEVAQAELPSGKHKLLISIEDNTGRVGTKLIEFEVK
jgi:hypothetical protein